MGIEERVEALERAYGRPAHGESAAAEVRARILKDLVELEVAGKGKAAAEEAAGNPRRRELLDELEETVKRRIAERQPREDSF